MTQSRISTAMRVQDTCTACESSSRHLGIPAHVWEFLLTHGSSYTRREQAANSYVDHVGHVQGGSLECLEWIVPGRVLSVTSSRLDKYSVLVSAMRG